MGLRSGTGRVVSADSGVLELERVFLASSIPRNLNDYPFVDIVDRYLPRSTPHPLLRLRLTMSLDDSATYELTKKVVGDDKSVRKFHTSYPYQGKILEINRFVDGLMGLVTVECGFSSRKDKSGFVMPKSLLRLRGKICLFGKNTF